MIALCATKSSLAPSRAPPRTTKLRAIAQSFFTLFAFAAGALRLGSLPVHYEPRGRRPCPFPEGSSARYPRLRALSFQRVTGRGAGFVWAVPVILLVPPFTVIVSRLSTAHGAEWRTRSRAQRCSFGEHDIRVVSGVIEVTTCSGQIGAALRSLWLATHSTSRSARLHRQIDQRTRVATLATRSAMPRKMIQCTG